MHYEQQEIVRHAVIGGLVAVSLASFHEIAETFAAAWFQGQSTPIHIIEWAALFVAVFIAIFVTVQVPGSNLLDKLPRIGYRMVDECAASRPAGERSGTGK
jgi:hypothetical protein